MNNKTEVIAMIKNMWMPHIGGFSGHDEILVGKAQAFVAADQRNARS